METSIIGLNVNLKLTPDEFFFLKQCVNEVDPTRHGLMRSEVKTINNQLKDLSTSLMAKMAKQRKALYDENSIKN